MPTVLRMQGFRFHFYSNEGQEPPHIHCRKDDFECKFWIDDIRLAENKGFKPHQIRDIEKLVYQYRELFLEKYHEFHNL